MHLNTEIIKITKAAINSKIYPDWLLACSLYLKISKMLLSAVVEQPKKIMLNVQKIYQNFILQMIFTLY